MCFGSKKEDGGALGARPARSSSEGRDDKVAHTPRRDYATPSGSPPAQQQNEYAPPSGPPPAQGSGQYAPPAGSPPAQQSEYGPPSGPPPGQQQSTYAPPSGPPPAQNSEQYAPPAGSPPAQQSEYGPPSGPPPGQQQNAYAPPSGPPPAQGSGQYAPPTGSPPAQQSEYGPPSGPPPGQQQSTYAPPSGPPPARESEQYAPPSGSPPLSSRNPYAAPPGPPPAQQSEQFAPPSGPPPQQTYAPPAGPPPTQQQSEYAPPSGPPPAQQDTYAPPPGPPPAQHSQQYAPPPGPPPSEDPPQYAPPLGPPPSQDYAPPPGPPPQSKPEHDWETAVPDTSLFPPPPAFFNGWDRSPSSNATEQEATRGTQWCKDNPLTNPTTLDPPALSALRNNDIQLMQPWGFTGRLQRVRQGSWDLATDKRAPDACVIGYPPLYAPTLHSPLATGRRHTVYYEVHVRGASSSEVSVALGFTALPYPNFRMPGWHRGSMAVHGDDGHRYVNDTWGGLSFTQPFRAGETYGVGMTFEAANGRIAVECFFTRNGVLDGKWDLHEEQDSDVLLPVTGLEGFHDVSCAVGTFRGVECEVVFEPSRWRYRPE